MTTILYRANPRYRLTRMPRMHRSPNLPQHSKSISPTRFSSQHLRIALFSFPYHSLRLTGIFSSCSTIIICLFSLSYSMTSFLSQHFNASLQVGVPTLTLFISLGLIVVPVSCLQACVKSFTCGTLISA